MKMRWVGAAAIAACLLSFVAPAAQAAPGPLIQPGEFMDSEGTLCTMSFIYSGTGGETYAGTAAHCVPEGIGADVALSDGTVFGDVAAIGNEGATETDWAIIRVRSAHLGRVSPAMKGHPTVPRGVATPGETAFGDQVLQSGYGTGFEFTALTREQRVSVLTYDDQQLFTALGASIFGDSGGPMVHKPTGKALGVVSRLCIGTCEMEGPTVHGILAQARAKGLTLTLRTA